MSESTVVESNIVCSPEVASTIVGSPEVQSRVVESLKTESPVRQVGVLQSAVVPSPVLMPPPNSFAQYHKAIHMPANKSKPKIFPTLSSSKLCVKDAFGFDTVDEFDSKLMVSYSHCSVPTNDVKFYVTSNNNIDAFTKNLVRYQISRKIYKQPGCNTRPMPKKNSEDVGLDIDPSAQSSGASGMKRKRKYFKHKSLTVDDIDVSSLEQPMRCSTPTPSLGGTTILAGHLDCTIDFDDLNCMLDSIEQEEIDAHDTQKNSYKLNKPDYTS